MDFAQRWSVEIAEAIVKTNRALAEAGCQERVSLQRDGCAGQRSACFAFGDHVAHMIAYDAADFLAHASTYLRAIRHTAAAFTK